MGPEYLDKTGLTYFWSKIKSKMSKDYDKLVSRGEQLIVNGSAMLGDNTNFSAWTYDGSQANGSAGSFTRSAGDVSQPGTDEFFPVDPQLLYRLDFDIKSKLGAGRLYSYLNFYDVDKKNITASDHMYMPGTLTFLTQDLKNGDTVVHLNDLTNWNVNTSTRTYQRGFIFWDYTNSFGYTYPENTYSRHHVSNIYTDANVNKTAKTITLTSSWTGGTIAANTKLSQCNSGSTFKYIGTINTLIATSWTHYSGFMEGTDYSGQNVGTKFPPGVAYSKVGFLWNYQGSGNGEQLWLTNLSVKALPIVSKSDGVLPIVNGGSGLSSSPSILTNLASTSATNVMQASPRPGVTGTLGIANGGTGQTTAKNAANDFLNALDTGSSTPVDADYYISQYVNGGSTTKTYHRRPVSALWEYIKGKISSVLGLTATAYGGSAAKVNNHTVASDVPSNAKFTDTVTTASTTGSGNVVSEITASNGALTVTKGVNALTSHQTIKQDGVSGATAIHFGVCSTAAGTAAKTVDILSGSVSSLSAGLRVIVYFEYTNTAESPTLNVNSTGAKGIVFGKGITDFDENVLSGPIEFVYYGSNWYAVGYGAFKVSSSGTGNVVSSVGLSPASGAITYTKGVTAITDSDLGAANGVCPLNADSQIDTQYLPGGTSHTHDNATTTTAGFMSATDKANLDELYDAKDDVIPVSRGGSGLSSSPSILTNLASTAAANVMQASPRPGVTGTLPIGNGGTGSTATTYTSTASSIVTAASGFSVTSAEYAVWGKLAMVHIVFKKNSTAISSKSNITLGTLANGKRPKMNGMAQYGMENLAMVYSDGTVHYYGTVAANASLGIYATYLLP